MTFKTLAALVLIVAGILTAGRGGLPHSGPESAAAQPHDRAASGGPRSAPVWTGILFIAAGANLIGFSSGKKPEPEAAGAHP